MVLTTLSDTSSRGCTRVPLLCRDFKEKEDPDRKAELARIRKEKNGCIFTQIARAGNVSTHFIKRGGGSIYKWP
jgi:hypothetical protein